MRPWPTLRTVFVLAPALLHALRRVTPSPRPIDSEFAGSDTPAQESGEHASPLDEDGLRGGAPDGCPLQLVAQYLPVRVDLVAALMLTDGISRVAIWEVVFSPGGLLGEPYAREIDLITASRLDEGVGCDEILNVRALPSHNKLLITCEVDARVRHVVSWDPDRRSETMPRLPISAIGALAPRGDMLLSDYPRPVALGDLTHGTVTDLGDGNEGFWFGTFSESGDKVAIVVCDQILGPEFCDLEVWNTRSSGLLCAVQMPEGARANRVAFWGDRIVFPHLSAGWPAVLLGFITFRIDADGDETCELVRETHAGWRLPGYWFGGMHSPSGKILAFNHTAVIVISGDAVWHSLGYRGRVDLVFESEFPEIFTDGESALFFFRGIPDSGSYPWQAGHHEGWFVWPFAAGKDPQFLGGDFGEASFSSDGAVIAGNGYLEGGEEIHVVHTSGGGALRFAVDSGVFRFVALGLGQPKTFAS